MSGDEALEELIYELQYLRSVVENIQQRVSLIDATLDELRAAISTIEGIVNEESACSMLVPIGGGSYIRARLEDSEKLIVGVGADVALEKTVDGAKEDFQSRILELEKVRVSLQQQASEISTQMSTIQREAQKMAQARGEAKNV